MSSADRIAESQSLAAFEAILLLWQPLVNKGLWNATLPMIRGHIGIGSPCPFPAWLSVSSAPPTFPALAAAAERH